MTDDDPQVSRAFVLDRARALIARVVEGDPDAVGALSELSRVESQLVAWVLATSLVTTIRGVGGLPDEDIPRLLDGPVDEAVLRDLERGLGDLEDGD